MKRIRKEWNLWIFGTFAVLGIAALTACQSGPPQISIEGAKAELSQAIIGEAMVSMKIVNQGGGDMMTGVKTNIPGATASFHVMQGERMAAVKKMRVPAKNTLEFKMGGSHVMIENMPKSMNEGSPFILTLVFEKSGEKQVPLTLQKAMPMPMSHEHHM